MSSVAFDVAVFRRDFPAFADSNRFPEDTLRNYFNSATCYISPNNSPCLQGDCRLQALNLMTAHLCQIVEDARTGKISGVATGSSVGRVSVSLAAPPFGSSQWAWWLNTTTYGQQLAALLDSIVAGGLYIGGSCERAGFRKIGGIF